MALAAADADLVRRDPALPGLALVLDPERLREVLAAEVGADRVGPLRATYLRYKPGTSCVVGYEIDATGVESVGPERSSPAWPVRAAVSAYRAEDAAKAGKAVEKAGADGALGWGAVTLAGGTVAVTLLPNDRDLPVLRRLADPGRRAKLLGPALGWRRAREADMRTLRYKPGRRWVGRLDLGRHAVLVKVHAAEDAYRRASAGAVAFGSPRRPRMPRLIAADEASRLLVTEWVPGTCLDDALRDGSAGEDDLRAAGESLARLHRLPAPGLLPVTAATRAEDLATAASTVAVLVPGLAGAAADHARRLGAAFDQRTAVLAPVHGDCSPDQFLATRKGAALVDFDAARLDDPAADLGLLVAALLVAELDGSYPAMPAAVAVTAARDGYTTIAPLPGGVALHTAAALLGLAAEPFRRRRPDWPQRTAAILELARASW